MEFHHHYTDTYKILTKMYFLNSRKIDNYKSNSEHNLAETKANLNELFKQSS